MELLTGIVLGLHLVSVHAPDDAYNLNNVNPGIYARTQSGWEAGVYYNSYRRPSLYAGKEFYVITEGVTASVGVVTGYERKSVPCINPRLSACYVGDGSAKVQPMAALNYTMQTRVLGGRPRISFLPLGTPALHLSLEFGN